MGTDKPLIAVLLALYEPRMDWLRRQLESLNAQDYPNLRLYVRDDCSRTVPFSEIHAMVESCICTFPCSVTRNERNLGSNGTFERLTTEAEGAYFAYCDQDDIWLPEKLSALWEAMDRDDALLACSDMYVIDEDGRQIAHNITRVRRHHVFRSGEGLGPKLIVSNYVTGCTMLIRADTARAAAPFCPDMVHVHYLALYAAREGRILSFPDPLIRYRIHRGNQTAMMTGVVDKESYYQIRILSMLRRIHWLHRRFSEDGPFSDVLRQAACWEEAHTAYFKGERKAGKVILKYRRFSLLTSLFELLMDHIPEKLFLLVIELKRRNRI